MRKKAISIKGELIASGESKEDDRQMSRPGYAILGSE